MLTQQQIQNARNLALLARQAISNGFATMQADPRTVADLCQSVEKLGTAPVREPNGNDPTLTPATPPVPTT